MEKDRSDRRPDALDGADAAALGTSEPPGTAPDGATVDPADHRVPGARADERLPTEAKPWFTSLVADSDQAGVANDEPDAQEPPVYERPDALRPEADDT